MASLSDVRVRNFLLHGTRTGKVAWVAADGAPHVAPIWFVIDGDDIVFNTGSDTGKGRALAREGRASLVVVPTVPRSTANATVCPANSSCACTHRRSLPLSTSPTDGRADRRGTPSEIAAG